MNATANPAIYLQPKQQQLYHLLTAVGPRVATKIGFGGSRGGAKSGGLRRCSLALAGQPGTSIWIVRRVSEDLRKDHITPFFDDFPMVQDYYKAQDKEIALPNKSRISFVYLEREDDVIRKCRGPQAQFMLVDQAEQFAESELQRMIASNRRPGSKPGECKMGFFFNPGGPGTEYLRRVFFLKRYEPGENEWDFAFLQSYGWDNYEWFRGLGTYSERDFYALPNDVRFHLFITETDYGKKLNALPEHLRIGELMGSFEKFAGQYYAAWEPEKIVIPAPLAEHLIQPWWTRWISTEWGFARHSATHWFASGALTPPQLAAFFGCGSAVSMNVVICYRELVTQQMGESSLAGRIAEMTPESERKQIRKHVLTPLAFAKRGNENTIADTMGAVLRKASLPYPQPADEDRVGGWRLLYRGMSQTGAIVRGEVTDEVAANGPMLLLSDSCTDAVEGFPLLIRDKDDPEDVAETEQKADHVCNSVRHGFKVYQPPSQVPRAVRRAELAHRYADPTMRVIALRQFESDNRRRVGHRSYR